MKLLLNSKYALLSLLFICLTFLGGFIHELLSVTYSLWAPWTAAGSVYFALKARKKEANFISRTVGVASGVAGALIYALFIVGGIFALYVLSNLGG